VRRAEVRRLMAEFCASERRACELMEIPRMSCRYQSRRDDSGLRERLLELAREKPRYGYRRLHVLLRRDGTERVNHKRVRRVYRELGLSVRRTRRKRLQRMLRPRAGLTEPKHSKSRQLDNRPVCRKEPVLKNLGWSLAHYGGQV